MSWKSKLEAAAAVRTQPVSYAKGFLFHIFVLTAASF
jgi:hypothetical protein